MKSKAVLGILVVVALAIGAVYLLTENQETTGQTISAQENEKIASVNGESITLEDVHRAKETLEITSEEMVTNEKALQRVVSEKLMLQEAEKEGISFTFEEAEQHLEQEMAKTGRTLEDVKEALEENERSYEEEVRIYGEQMTIQKLLAEKVPEPEITDEQARAYYEQNKNAMFTGEVVPYENVAPQLKQAIAQQEQQKTITEYLTNLRESSDIVYPNQNE